MRVFFDTIGVICISLLNVNYEEEEDILRINDFSRRVYPQFLTNESMADDAKTVFLPKFINVYTKNGKLFSREDFKYDTIPNLYEIPKLSKHISKMFGKKLNDSFSIGLISDDRMYVMCHINKGCADGELQNNGYMEKPRNDFWYRFIFVDGENISCFHQEMKKNLIETSTYPRWVDDPMASSLYGVTSFSFMLYSNFKPLKEYFSTLYKDMVILRLVQRAMLLRFSFEISSLLLKKNTKDISKDSSALNYKYISFVNLAYFDEITPHEQGADLYELIGRKMKIKRYVENLDRELSELHQFVSIKEESERNTRLETISRLGAIFLPPTLLASLYGMNIVNFDTESLYGKWTGLLMIFTSAIIGYGLINISHRKLRLILGIAFFAFIIFVMVGLYPQK